MANTFEHIYIFNTIPVQESAESGKEYKLYSCIQTWPSNQDLPENYAWVAKEYFDEFYKNSKRVAGFVTFTLSEDGTEVTSMTWDENGYQHYLDTLDPWSLSAIPQKVNEFSKICQQTIENGADIVFDEADAENTTEHFDFTTEDQANINSMFNAVLLGATEYPYHSKGNICKVYSKDQISKIYITMQATVTGQISYYNAMKNYLETEFAGLRDENSENTFRAIQYGDPLTGAYLENYNAMMQVANTQVQAIVTSLSAEDKVPVEEPETGSEGGVEGGTDTGSEVTEPTDTTESTESTGTTDTKEEGSTEA